MIADAFLCLTVAVLFVTGSSQRRVHYNVTSIRVVPELQSIWFVMKEHDCWPNLQVANLRGLKERRMKLGESAEVS